MATGAGLSRRLWRRARLVPVDALGQGASSRRRCFASRRRAACIRSTRANDSSPSTRRGRAHACHGWKVSRHDHARELSLSVRPRRSAPDPSARRRAPSSLARRPEPGACSTGPRSVKRRSTTRLRRALSSQTSILTTENAMKFDWLRPTPDRFDFSARRRDLGFALESGKPLRGQR